MSALCTRLRIAVLYKSAKFIEGVINFFKLIYFMREVNVELWGCVGLRVCAVKWILWMGLGPTFRYFPAGQKQNAKSLHWYMDSTCDTDSTWFQSSKFSEAKS